MISSLFIAIIFFILIHYNLISIEKLGPHIYIIFILLSSCIIGVILTALFHKRPFRPIENLLKGIEEISNGNYNVRLHTVEFGGAARIVDSFNKMAQELGSIETLRNDFIGSFSHEFKTPINSIKGFAKLLKNKNLSDDERKEYLNIIIDESERLSQLATNTLNFTKIESQEMVLSTTEYKLDEQIRQSILILEPKWNKKKLNLNVDLEETVFDGNVDLLQQVWINLIDNAIKFTPENGDVFISLKKVQSDIVVIISDSGCGMSEETKKRMFDKFYQADKSRITQGHGLGLAIVYKIIKLAGGEIKVKSEIGQGSAFTIILPIGKNEDITQLP